LSVREVAAQLTALALAGLAADNSGAVPSKTKGSSVKPLR